MTEHPVPDCTSARLNWKFINGLFLSAISLLPDRVSFAVYASRPFDTDELSRLPVRLADSEGTAYQLLPPEGGAIDGKAQIEFVPSVPSGCTVLQLSAPGVGLHIPVGGKLRPNAEPR
jgi:hypothetical protein